MQLDKTGGADGRRRLLRKEIAVAFLGQTRVKQYKVEYVFNEDAGTHDLDEWDAQTLHKERCGVARIAAGHVSAHVRVVGDVRAVPHEDTIDEYRRDHRDVGQVGATTRVGVVGDEHVAGLDRLTLRTRDTAAQAAHGASHRSHVDGDVLGLRDESAGAVKQRGGAVGAFFDVC